MVFVELEEALVFSGLGFKAAQELDIGVAVIGVVVEMKVL
jgi:hypothetical protein